MKELILQLQAKLTELKALQAADPTINTAFTQAEIDQLVKIEAFAKPRIAAVQAHEAKKQEKQTPKTETPVGLPDPKAVKTTETPVGLPDPKAVKTTETPVGLPDPKAVKTTETPVGLPDPKAVKTTETTKTETPKEDTDLEDFLKPEEEEEGDNVTLTVQTADFQEISETLEKNDAPKEIVDALKEVPTVTGKITENGAEVKVAKGDNSVEVGFETNEDGSLKTAKVEIETKDLVFGLEKTEDGGSGKIGGKVTDAEGSEITAVVNVGIDTKKGEATLGGSYSKEKIDGSKLELEGELKVSKEGVAIKGSKMETDADGNKKGVEGELEITKEKVKVGFGLGTENEDKGTNTEIGGSLELAKNKAVLELKGKHKFPVLPKKKLVIPFASVAVADLALTLSAKVDAEVEVKAGAKLEYDDKKGLDAMAKLVATGKVTLECAIGLQLTLIRLAKVAAEFVLTTYIQATAELAFQLNSVKNRSLAALHNVKGGLSTGVRLVIGASDEVIKIYEALGGSGSSLEFSYDLGTLELIAFTAPSYHSGKGWDLSTWSFGKGKDLIAIENKCAWVRDLVDTTVAVLEAICKFIGGVLRAIGRFVAAFVEGIMALGKAAGEYLLSWISPEAARKQREQAANDAAFEKVIAISVENVKKNPKLVQRLNNVPEASREAELQKIVREDKMVLKAWKYIFEGATFEQRAQLAEQLTTSIQNFKIVVPNPTTQLTKVLMFSATFNATNKEGGTGNFTADAIRFRLYCNGACVVNDALNKVIVKNGANQINTSMTMPAAVQLPRGADLKTAKWQLAAVIDLEGDIKDVESARIPITVTAPPPPSKAEIAATATVPPPAKLHFMGAGAYIVTFKTPDQFLTSSVSIDLTNSKFFTAAQLSSTEFTVILKADGKIVSSIKHKTPLKANVSQHIMLPKMTIPTFMGLQAANISASAQMWEIVVVANGKEIVKRPLQVKVQMTIF